MQTVSKYAAVLAAAALTASLAAAPAEAQMQRGPRPSPAASVSQTLGSVTVTVKYGRPGVKGRTIFGELVPYDTVWRAGANEATTVEVSGDVTINGQTLKAGRYGFHLLPRQNGAWTAIFTDQPDVWGIPYQEGHEVLQVEVTTRRAPAKVEWLTYSFPNLEPAAPTRGELVLSWDMVEVPLRIDAGGGM